MFLAIFFFLLTIACLTKVGGSLGGVLALICLIAAVASAGNRRTVI
jgi:hypothetical protein